jgi:predicted DNA-binding WGR domain protein
MKAARDRAAEVFIEKTSAVTCLRMLLVGGAPYAIVLIGLSNRSSFFDSNFALDSLWNPCRRFHMADQRNSDSADSQLILERTDPAYNVARYYVLSIEATLFARNTFVQRWGRIGSTGRQRLEFFDNRDSAGLALETWLARKRKPGHALR